MGDGGVACAPSQHVMEILAISDGFCGGGNGGFGSKENQLAAGSLRERKMGVDGGEGDAAPSRSLKSEVEKVGVASSGRSRQRQVEKGEVVLPEEQSPSDEIEKGEILPENGEVVAGRWRKGELENGEFVLKKWRQEEDAKGRNLHRVSMDELENGEFVPDRWRRISEVKRTKHLQGEEAKDGFLSEKVQSWELEKGDMAPESCGANDYASSRRNQSSSSSSKRGARELSASRRKRSSSRWDPSIEKELSKSGSSKGDEKLEPAKSDSNSKYHGEYNHPSGSKCRRLSVDGHSSSHSEKPHSRLSVERPYKHSSSSTKVPSSSRCESPRHHDSSSSKGTHDKHGKSPAYSERERSPHDRARKAEHRDRSSRSHHDRGSPGHSLRSPLDRSGRHHRHGRSPVHLERSPLDRNRDYRERTPKRTPADSGRDSGRLRSNGKTKGSSEGLEKQHNCSDEKTRVRDSNGSGIDSHKSSTSRHTRKNNDSSEKCNENQSLRDKDAQNDVSVCADDPPTKEAEDHEEPPSMEEDMDICNTPPHTPVTVDLNMGKWFYLDYNGLEQGPSKLGDLKQLVEEGIIQSDHLVKHSDSDRWVTAENAASPIISVNYSSIVSDSVTQLVTPPEAPGNLLHDSGNFQNHLSQYDDNSTGPEHMEDLHFDERIEALMEGRVLVPGQELVTLGEALNLTFEHVEWEKCGTSEDFMSSRSCFRESLLRQREQDYGGGAVVVPKENSETRFYVNSEKDFSFPNTGFCEWFTIGHWTCKGGDWKRNDEVALDKAFRKKVILNEGYPLCQTSKTGHEDPRRHRKEDLYVSLRGRNLDLPLWAFSLSEENNDSNVAVKSCQMKPLATRVKGTMQPVVKINACVVRDRGSAVGDSRHKSKSNDRQASLKPVKSFSSNTDGKGSSSEGVSQSKRILEEEITPCGNKSRSFINIPEDKVRKMNELDLKLGDWFYLDGAGHEHGPKSFSELQVLAAKGTIEMSSSVFRKVDNLWVPISNVVATSRSARSREGKLCSVGTSSTSSFNNMHPQFVGYMRGKLHELVMKSFRSREFAAAINEVLDPWIAAKQPKKEIDRQFTFNNSLPKDEGYARFGKRARFMSDAFEEPDDFTEDPLLSQKDHTFEDLFPEIPHNQDSDSCSDGWGLLNCRVLARVFHFLRTDFKSLAFSAGTCRFWNSAVKAYRSVSKHVDFSFVGPACTDAIFNTILLGYDKSKVKSISLRGCSNINVIAVEDILKSFSSIESIDIRESGHLGELSASYKEVNWIGGRRSVDTNPEDSYSKIRSLKQVTERSYINSLANWEYGSHIYDPANKINPLSDKKILAANSIQQTPYNRRKLFGARKATAVLSRDAHLRRWLSQKSENRYKKMEEYLASYLKDIMKKNTCDFFVPKVAEIEDKMKNDYYTGHGLSSIREDISKMCRAAFRTKNHGDKGEMNRMIMLFIKLIRSLDNPPRISSSCPRDEVEGVSGPAASTCKKKLGKATSEKKGLRSNGSIYGDGSTENGERASDREIKRRLNKLNRRTLDSESETSDDLDLSEEDSNGADGDGTNSDTESDIDFHSVGVNEDAGEGFSFVVDGPMDSMADEREWGARMTKASLVPPVTRKYEVIDKYVITADAEEVRRKMKVSLPDDYANRLNAQKDSDEPDPDFVEVKEYKPRKKLGDEVLEQEVYGIDPYTHNLLLDSVPEEMPDWTFSEKHVFIEELVLRVLNKQVRHFTDTGNTPMTYPLRPVLEEIQTTAEDDGNKRITKLCQIILKAIRSRPEDHYVAYRKGLGVVCDKEGGFKEDDFVVEFLGEVYPTWRWFEKQDGIRSLQKNKEDPAPEFYNIYLERPKGDKDGYDLVVVDAMHKANYASRICHSCRPNCEAKVTAVNGQYQIGIYAIRPIAFGEEITFDYNSVTESKEEYEASVCLCGSQVCRGSYLNLTGDGAFQKVMKECHGILDRHQLMLEACELNYVTEDDYLDLGRASLGSCLLSGLPDWVIAYSARMVRFINFERTKLPDEILAYNLEEKRKLYLDVSLEVETNEAEIQAEGVYNQRLQNLAITLDKVRYVLRSVYGDARKAPPPLEKLSPESLVSALWKGSGSLVDELLQCMAPHMEEEILNELKSKIDAHDPSGSSDIQKELQKSLLWLRDEVRNLPCSPKCRHDAAADLIHAYAYTKYFFRVRGQGQVTSEPVYICPLDLGPKYADKMSSGGQEYLKTYSDNYCLGQLIYWHNQTNPDPDCRLTRARQGCLLLPDIASFYFKSQKPSPQRVYGRRTVKFMLSRMEKQPQRAWPKNRIWQFKSDPKIFGSPMLDAVISKSKLDKEMVHWLRSRTSMYQATWDR